LQSTSLLSVARVCCFDCGSCISLGFEDEIVSARVRKSLGRSFLLCFRGRFLRLEEHDDSLCFLPHHHPHTHSIITHRPSPYSRFAFFHCLADPTCRNPCTAASLLKSIHHVHFRRHPPPETSPTHTSPLQSTITPPQNPSTTIPASSEALSSTAVPLGQKT